MSNDTKLRWLSRSRPNQITRLDTLHNNQLGILTVRWINQADESFVVIDSRGAFSKFYFEELPT